MKKLPIETTSYAYLEKAFKEWLSILGFVPATVYGLPNIIREFLYFLERNKVTAINQITHYDIKKYYEYLISRASQRQGGALSSSYINHQFWAIEKFFEFLQHKGTQGLPQINLKRLKIEVLQREILTIEEVKELYKIAEHKDYQTRKQEALNYQDRILLTIYYACGLRRTEGIHVSVDDINFDTRVLHVKKGKNSKQRLIPFNKTISKALQDWVFEHRAVLVKDKTESRLFINRYGKPLTGNTLNCRLKQLIDQSQNVQLKEKNITLHSLRHSIATHLLSNGMDMQKVQRFLGHTSLETTQIYTHLLEEKEN